MLLSELVNLRAAIHKEVGPYESLTVTVSEKAFRQLADEISPPGLLFYKKLAAASSIGDRCIDYHSGAGYIRIESERPHQNSIPETIQNLKVLLEKHGWLNSLDFRGAIRAIEDLSKT